MATMLKLFKRLSSININMHSQLSSCVQLDFGTLPEHRSLVLEKYGEPEECVSLQVRKPAEVLPKELEPKQVLVEHLAATVNPADINMIQGVYGIKPKLPAIIGNEGVMRVKNIGSDVKHLKPGQMALAVSLVGNWQNYSVQQADHLYAIEDGLDASVAAQIKVNPCTAYRMMKDFVDLKPGDTMIQNGANSAVGVYAIQLGKLWGIKTVNVIRDRPNKDEIVNELKGFGADFVVTEEEVGNVEVMSPVFSEISKPKLFLNCVGGKNAVNCQRHLDQGGYSVTYGAMSKMPFSLSATSLIFKDHRFVGFWMSRWFKEREGSRREEIQAMLNEIGGLFKRGALKSKSTTLLSFEERNIAFNSGAGSTNTKYVFSINKR